MNYLNMEIITGEFVNMSLMSNNSFIFRKYHFGFNFNNFFLDIMAIEILKTKTID